MSDMMHPPGRDPGLGYHRMAARWGWFVFLGAIMVLAGVFALGDTVVVTVLSVLLIGAAMIVSGIFQIIHAFANKDWTSFLFGIACGLLYLVAGVAVIEEPIAGALVITIILSVSLAIGGGLRAVMAVQHREIRGWWLILVGGIISVALAVLLYVSLPWSGLWVLGTLIGVEMLVQGFTWINLGLALRGMHRAA